MQFTDAVTVAGTRRRDDGYLVADARIARTGVQVYLGPEVGKPDMARVSVYRPGAEVFHEDTLKSAAHRPVTNDHPPEQVNSTNWKQYAVGQTGDEIAGEGIFLRVPLMVSDEETIKAIESGKQELSAGYTCDLDFTPGHTPAGEAYDAIQKNIRINHVAIVQRGRAGSQVRIGDAAHWGAAPVLDHSPQKEPTMTLKTVTVDGIPIEVTDQGATVISTLQQRLADASAGKDKLIADHASALAAKDSEIAKKDAEIDALKGKVMDAAALDAAVKARSDLIAKAKGIVPTVATDGKSDAEIRHAVVAAKIGDAAIKDKPAAYIDARFDILAEDAAKGAGTDPFRTVVQQGLTPTNDADASGKAYQAMTDGLTSAWQNPNGKAA
jgi:hypothetical protein